MSEASLRSEESSVIVFEEGIIGVPRAKRFHLLEQPGSPLRLLRCLDIEGFCLPVVDPRLADPGYGPDLGPRLARALDLVEGDGLLVLAVATLEPEGPVANLRAPVVVNVRSRLAAQVILEDRSHPLRAPVREREEPSRSRGDEAGAPRRADGAKLAVASRGEREAGVSN